MRQYEVITKARHLRYIYFVREGYESDKLYDLLWVNQNLWGGRLNPIVPVLNGVITEQWKDVIRHHDPDYILYTDKVSEI